MGAFPRGFAPPETAEDQARLRDIAAHVLSVTQHRALSPGERLMVLMMAAATVTVQGAVGDDRARAMELGCLMYGAAMRGAARAVDEWLAGLPPEGAA